MSSVKEIFPPVETVIELEPEEFAPFVLKYLENQQNINRYNFTLGTSPELQEYAGQYLEELLKRLMEAWIWLEREMFIAPKPGTKDDWQYITRRGKKILEEQNFELYKKSQLLPSENLDPILVRKVKPLFIRGDYDTAVFQAFKEVEIRVRKKGEYDNNEIGVKLMRKAFHPQTGLLTNKLLEEGERQSIMELFSGAIGVFKNPSSHREVEYTDPHEVSDIIHIANQLLRYIDNLSKSQ